MIALIYQDRNLIFLALAAVAALVVFVTRWKFNPFIALALASLIVGAGAVAMGVTPKDARAPLTMVGVIEGFGAGIGKTLGGIAAVIGLGTMLGKLLAESGGAEVLAKRFAAIFGPKRVIWCIMALAVAVGLPTWFAVGLVLLLPILLTLTAETKKPFLLLAIPLLSCLSVMHGLMPPHPGPVAALAAFKEARLDPNMGMVLVWGFVIGLPTAIVAGPIFARRAARTVEAQPPPMPVTAGREGITLPPFGLTLFAVLLPVMLMLVDTVAKVSISSDAARRTDLQTTILNSAGFIGNATIALLTSVLFAAWALGLRCGYNPARVWKFTEESIAAVGMTLLVVGGGGGFAFVLKTAGVADAMGTLAKTWGLPILLYGWMVSAFIRVSTGSATVAITTAAGLVAPVMGDYPGTNIELLIIAIGCGSLFLSHLNDGGFWIVKECLGLSVSQTLRTWTITETIVGIAGLLLTLVVHAVWQALHH
jgi:GntP family gluconate:H+ symporter